MNHCVSKIFPCLVAMLPVLAAGGCDTSSAPSTAGSGGAAGEISATGGAPETGGTAGGSSLETGGTIAATGGTPETGGTTGDSGGASSVGGMGSGGVSISGGATTSGGVTESGGAGGGGGGATNAGGKAGSGGATVAGGTSSAGGTPAPYTGPIPSGTPVSVHGQLKVDGNKIVDQNGKTVVLHGMSMYDWSQQGRQFYNASAVGHLAKDLECAILRIPILPQNATSGLSRVKAVADACIANGIYGIIDWHGGSAATAATAAAFFASMAQAYGDTPNIMYEPWNEPTVPWATVKTYHETVIAAIRAVDPDNIIFLGTPQWDQKPDSAAADPVTTSTNLAYVVHFYANSHKLAGFQNAITTTLNKGLAIFVTEYGGCSANGNGTFNATELQKWWDFLDANNIGCTNWAVETNGETSSIFKTNAAANGPWTDADLTDPDGVTIINYIKSKYATTLMP
jgi:endoglucanase